MKTNEPRKKAGPQMGSPLGRAAKLGRKTEDEILLAEPPAGQLFTHTDPWRVLRITGEFVEGFDALADLGPAIVIFGSARVKESDPMYQDAVKLAELLGEAGFSVITGGGPGIMEAGNRGAQNSKTHSVGLNIELPFEQHINPYVDIAVDFRYFFVRKTMFVKYGYGFVIFPGGFGTLDELFEALVLVQTGKLRNFPIILYGKAYWAGLINWIRETLLAEAKISASDLELLVTCDNPEAVRDVIVHSYNEQNWGEEKERAAREGTRKAYERDIR